MKARDPHEPHDSERLLAHLTGPTARPEFKARLRDTFVNAGSTGASDVTAALDAFDPPRARAEFKAELRGRFVGASGARVARAPRTRGARARTLDLPRPARTQSRRLRLVASALATAAAAAILILFLRPGGASPEWVIDGAAALVLDHVRVDGQSQPAGLAPADLARALVAASEISTGAEPLVLRLADRFAVLMEPESTLEIGDLDSDPGRWHLHGRRGSFRVRTGPGYDPASRLLRFTTPHAEFEAHGTVFGLDIDPAGTCACCLESSLTGNYLGAEKLNEVPSEYSLYLSTSTSVHPKICIKAPHLQAVREFDTQPIAWR